MKIAFFGHPGSFTESAAKEYVLIESIDTPLYIPCISIKEVFETVDKGSGFIGVIPIFNTHAGDVPEYVSIKDCYVFEELRKIQIGIVQNLLGNGSSTLVQGSEVYSHSHALKQCSDFIEKTGLVPIPHTSTSSAARDLSLRRLADGSMIIGHDGLSKIYGLRILKAGIENEPSATTFLAFTS